MENRVLTDAEVKEEARKRIENMTEAQKKAALGMTDAEQERLDNAKNYWEMSKEEQQKFRTALLKKLDSSHVGGLDQGGFERDLLDDYGITRDDLKNGAKNPFKKELIKLFLIIFGLNVVSAVLAVLGVFKEAIIGLEGASGILALYIARVIMRYFKFKKLQKQYQSGELTEQEIDAEVYRQLLDEKEKKQEEQKEREKKEAAKRRFESF